MGTKLTRLNTLIGSGMLALPYALSVQGFVVGLVSLLLAAFGSYLGQRMLAECAYKLNTRNSSYGMNIKRVDSKLVKLCSIRSKQSKSVFLKMHGFSFREVNYFVMARVGANHYQSQVAYVCKHISHEYGW